MINKIKLPFIRLYYRNGIQDSMINLAHMRITPYFHEYSQDFTSYRVVSDREKGLYLRGYKDVDLNHFILTCCRNFLDLDYDL